MIDMDLKVEIDDAVRGLVDMGVDAKKAMTGILNQLAQSGRNLARSNIYASGMGHVDGWLKRHIYGRRRSDSHAVVAAPRFMAEILERGGTITARKSKYLTFKVNGEWRKVKSVTIPPKKWFTSAMSGFEKSPVFSQAIDKGVEKIVKKFNKERGEL